MEPRSSTSRYILTTLAIILVITAFILVGLNALQLQNRNSNLGLSLLSRQTDQAYKEGYLAARQKYQSLCPLPASTNLLMGTIISSNGTSLRVEEHSLDTDFKVDGIDNIRTITLSATTTVVAILPKTTQQLLAEQSATPTGQTPAPAAPFTQQTLRFSDLKPGMKVTVQSSHDVRLAQTIAATNITVTR